MLISRKVMTAAVVALSLAGSASIAVAADDKATYDALAAEAKAAKKKAASVGGEWRDIGKFLKKAEEAAGKEDYATAIKLAKKAKFQSEAGYEQAMAQQTLVMPSYLK